MQSMGRKGAQSLEVGKGCSQWVGKGRSHGAGKRVRACGCHRIAFLVGVVGALGRLLE